MDERYRNNEINWPIGSYVIHRADRKDGIMLMIVTGVLKDGRIITKYIHEPHPGMHGAFHNDKKHLLAPRRFDIELPPEHALPSQGRGEPIGSGNSQRTKDPYGGVHRPAT